MFSPTLAGSPLDSRKLPRRVSYTRWGYARVLPQPCKGAFSVTSIIGYMNRALGRALRFVLGVALIAYGLLVLGGTVGTVVAIVGLLPIALALWGHCLLELAAPRSPSTV